MNLKPKKKTGAWHDSLHKKYLVGVVAIAFVLMINQIVFSVLLKNRDMASAFTVAAASSMFRDLGDQKVAAGTNDVLLAELWVPDGWTREGLACGWQLDDPSVGYNNVCFDLIDGDGAATKNAGLDNDVAKYLMNLDPANNIAAGSLFFKPSDHVCANSLALPVEDVYVDGGDGIGGFDCIPGNDSNPDIVILDKTANGLVAPTYSDLSSLGPNGEQWVHSEVVQANGAYDYNPSISGNVYIETTGQCPGTASLSSPTQLVAWSDITNDGIYQPGEVILFDGSGCLTGSGACAEGGCSGSPLGAGSSYLEIYAYDSGATGCPGVASDGVWQTGEPGWVDTSFAGGGGVLGTYDGSDLLLYDPATCLTKSGTEVGFMPYKGKAVESIWLINGVFSTGLPADTVLQQGSLWMNWGATFIPGTQWQGDAPGTWAGNEAFSDTNSTVDFGDAIVINYDNDNSFTAGADEAVDCDGSATTGVGTCATLNEGDSLSGYFVSSPFMLCTDTLNTPTCVWYDADLDDNCATFTTQTLILGTPGCEATALTNANNWSFYDNAGGTVGVYDLGDDIYKGPGTESSAYGTYSTRADLDVYSSGISHGNGLLSIIGAVGSRGFKVIYADADDDGILGSTDTVLEDNGIAQTGFLSAPNGNGVIDRVENTLNFGMVSFGPYARPDLDITNIRLEHQYLLLGGSGFCSGLDNPGLTMIFNSREYIPPAFPPGTNITFPLFGRFCLVGDIPATAQNNARITPRISGFSDSNGNKMYDAGPGGTPGDRGFFFFAKGTSGPTDGDLVLPYTITVTSGVPAPNTGNYNPPASPSDINLLSLEIVGGQVKITWQDPADQDIDKILIYRDGYVIAEVAKGTQLYMDSDVVMGQTYKYKIIARDIQGNLSLGQEKSITLPQELAAPACQLPAGVEVGDLIMADGQSTIYWVSDECKRNPFPTASVYFSYYATFPSKAEISLSIETISQIGFGDNMTLRPGTNLMKLSTDPKVYAVEPDGILRWVSTAQVANTLYGANWASRLVDMPDTFFTDYEVGAELTTAVYPEASLIQYSASADIWYLTGTQKRLVSPQVFTQQHFQDKFVAKNVNAGNFTFTEGAPLVETAEFSIAMVKNNDSLGNLFPFLNTEVDYKALFKAWQSKL